MNTTNSQFQDAYIKLQDSTKNTDFVETMDYVEACADVYDPVGSPELSKQIHSVLKVLWHEVGQNESCYTLNKALGPYVKSYTPPTVPEELVKHPDFVRTCLYLSALLDSGMSFNAGGEKHYTRELMKALPGVATKSPPKDGWVEFVAHGLLRNNWRILNSLYSIDPKDISTIRADLLALPDDALMLGFSKNIESLALPGDHSTTDKNIK